MQVVIPLFCFICIAGWLLLGNYTVDGPIDAVNKQWIDLKNLHILREAKGIYLLDPSPLLRLNFTTMRFYCYKPSVDRVLHFMTSDTDNGKYVVSWLRGDNVNRLIFDDVQKCTDALKSLEGDTSILSQSCNSIGYPFHDQKTYTKFYTRFLCIPNVHVLQINWNSFLCDDFGIDDFMGRAEYFLW